MERGLNTQEERELVLEGPLTSETAAQTRECMLALLTTGAGCVIHAHEVTQLDAAGAQLLYAFRTEAMRRGAEVRWASTSVFLVEAARILGMARCLGLTELPAGAAP